MSQDLDIALKPADAWWTVLVIDPIAFRVLPWMVGVRRITPNGITTAAAGLGVADVACFATGHLTVGALLFELRFVLDCLDGKLARARKTTSQFGARLDRYGDAVIVTSSYAALCATLATTGDLSWWTAFLPALASAAVVCADLALGRIRNEPVNSPAAPARWERLRIVSVMRRHRLTLRPWTVEIETTGLFLGPLMLRGQSLASAELLLAVAYAVCLAADATVFQHARAARQQRDTGTLEPTVTD